MSPDLLVSHSAAYVPNNAQVYVIDDNLEMRRSLHVLLGTAGITTWPFGNARDFLDQIDDLRPAPILLDIRMPELDGVEVMTKLADKGCSWPVIIMTAHGDVSTAVKLMKLGAIEFLEKPFDLNGVMTTLERAYQIVARVGAAETSAIDARQRFALLSRREAEVVSGLLKATPNKALAVNLSLSIRTIEMHRANALRKLGTKSVAGIIALAQQAHWVGPVEGEA